MSESDENQAEEQKEESQPQKSSGGNEEKSSVEFQEMQDDGTPQPRGDENGMPISNLEAIYEVPVQVSAVLGRSTMPVNQLLKLGRGAVVELDRKVGEAIDIYVNNRLVARGEVVVVEDKLGITMTEILKGNNSDKK